MAKVLSDDVAIAFLFGISSGINRIVFISL